MPSKRRIIEQLNKKELQEITTSFELTVADKRVKDRLAEAVISSRKVTQEAVLSTLSRDRLKELCRNLGIDDTSREKAVLIERLIGKVSTPKSKISTGNPSPPNSKISPKPSKEGEGGPVIEKTKKFSSVTNAQAKSNSKLAALIDTIQNITVKASQCHLTEEDLLGYVKSLFDKKFVNEKSFEQLALFRDAILPKLLSGEMEMNCAR